MGQTEQSQELLGHREGATFNLVIPNSSLGLYKNTWTSKENLEFLQTSWKLSGN